MNILFLSLNGHCQLVDYFYRALQLNGGGRLLGTIEDGQDCDYERCLENIVTLPERNHKDYAEELATLLLKESIDLLIPLAEEDLSTLNRNRNYFQLRCPQARLLLSPSRTIEISQDKARSRENFLAVGAMVPEQSSDHYDYHYNESDVDVLDTQQMAVINRKCREQVYTYPVSGPLYQVDVLCDFKSNALLAMARMKIDNKSELSLWRLTRHQELESLAKRIAEHMRCTGPVTINFRRAENDIYIATGVSACMQKGIQSLIAAGIDWPGYILELVRGKVPNINKDLFNDGLSTLRFDASVFIPELDSPSVAVESVKGIIFDMDDTIFPEKDFVFSGYRAVAEKVYADYQVDIEPILRNLFNNGRRRNIFALALDELAIAHDETYLKSLVTIYREHPPNIKPYLDVNLIQAFKQNGFKIGLITDGWQVVQRNKIRALNIDYLFDAIVVSDEIDGCKSWKPSPLPYLECCKLLMLDPEDTIYVGDNPAKDFIGAHGVKMKSIRIRRRGAEHEHAMFKSQDHKAMHEIKSLSELNRIVRLSTEND